MIDVHCERSPDGRHDVRCSIQPGWNSGDGCFARCRYEGCDFTLSPKEVEYKVHVNVVLRLTAEEADKLIDILDAVNFDVNHYFYHMLVDYAARWRGLRPKRRSEWNPDYQAGELGDN